MGNDINKGESSKLEGVNGDVNQANHASLIKGVLTVTVAACVVIIIALVIYIMKYENIISIKQLQFYKLKYF